MVSEYTALRPSVAETRRWLQVEALIAGGIAPGATDRAKHSGAHFAAGRGELEVLQLLHAVGVDMDADDATGRSPLHYAAAGNHEAAVTFLVDKACWLDSTDEDNMTPLHHAAAWRAPEAAARLLKAGAKPQLVNDLDLRPIGAPAAASATRYVLFGAVCAGLVAIGAL